MAIYINDNQTGQIIKTLHSLAEFYSFERKQGKMYTLKPGLNGNYEVWLNESEVKE